MILITLSKPKIGKGRALGNALNKEGANKKRALRNAVNYCSKLFTSKPTKLLSLNSGVISIGLQQTSQSST